MLEFAFLFAVLLLAVIVRCISLMRRQCLACRREKRSGERAAGVSMSGARPKIHQVLGMSRVSGIFSPQSFSVAK